MLTQFGKMLIFIGILLIAIGGLFMLARYVPWIGRLPGDIHLKGKRWTFFFPITTCVLISIVLTLILWLINFFRRP